MKSDVLSVSARMKRTWLMHPLKPRAATGRVGLGDAWGGSKSRWMCEDTDGEGVTETMYINDDDADVRML